MPAPPQLRQPGGTGAVRVALLLPLSGQAANVGRALLDAAQLALFDAARDRFALIVRDTEGNPDTARRMAEEALAEGAELILGPLFAAEVQAVAPAARAREVNVIAFSTDRTVAGGGVFLLGFTPEEQVEQVIAHAHENGFGRFAALLPDSPYGRVIEAAFRRAVEERGASVGRIASYPPDMADFTGLVRGFADYDLRRAALMAERRALAERADDEAKALLARLMRQDTLGDPAFDAVLIPEGGQRLKSLAPVLPYFDIDPAKVKFLGTGQWDQPGLGVEPALQGAWFAAPPPAYAENFRQRFETAYRRRPPRIASLAYDATALAAALAAEPPAFRYTGAALTNPNGFAGFDGIFRFRADGIAERGLAILEVRRNGVRVIRPAPESFQAVGQ
ncbi:MAG: penicillin-binding protein activator [Alphaproteobacteria bacterium]|nr:penicillin-binding protein activator [Alphaproteobacteria bacterium]